MKSLIVFICITFCFMTTISAQLNSEIFRMETRVESASIGTYNVNVLVLNQDNSYELLWQTYSSKKMSKNNVVLNFKRERGSWEKNNGKIHLIPLKENKQKMEFIFLGKNKISTILENGDISPTKWKRI